MLNKETVRALVNAFNIHNYFSNTVETNFKLQSSDKEDYIVVSFDKGMDDYQCRRYLDSIKRKIIREFYGIEESNDAEILDTAKLIFDVKSFPFDISKGELFEDKYHGFKFTIPVNKGVIFNLKSHLASSLEKDVLENMQVNSTTVPFNKEKYLCCSKFPDKQLRKEFEREFLSKMRDRYGYRDSIFNKVLKVKGNSVYIKDVFDDAHFIDKITQYKAWLTGMDLGVDNNVDHRVQLFKNMVIRSIYQVATVMIDGFMSAPPLDGTEASVLTPIIRNGKGIELLTKENARAINRAFENPVLEDVSDKVQAEILVNGDGMKYGIDFSNPEISHCVITKIMESSVINKNHELSIDPELGQQLSPVLSPRIPFKKIKIDREDEDFAPVSVINKDHELSIDRLCLQPASPPRTPPEQIRRDSGVASLESSPNSKSSPSETSSSAVDDRGKPGISGCDPSSHLDSSTTSNRSGQSIGAAEVPSSSSGELLRRQTSLTSSQKKELDSGSLSPEKEQQLYLMYTPGGKRELHLSYESEEEQVLRLATAQLPHLSSEKVNKDSVFFSGLFTSPAVESSVSPKLKECRMPQQVESHSEKHK